MSKTSKKQPAKKRAYVKKSSKWLNKDAGNSIKKNENTQAELNFIAPKAELDEIEFLDAVVTGVEQLSNEQRSRFINYIYSRYRVYITLSKLTQ